MSDVPGKFYSARKVRTGVSPSSPGVEVGGTTTPVNPAGTSINSVGLTMPTAFSVANSPLTSNGTIAVSGAGTVGQYIRGDGSLADFPATTGGGSSVSYYLNGSVSQGTIGGVAYKELNKMPVFGAGTDITRNSDGYIASFITDAGDPNKLLIPAGNWNLETYFSASSNGGSPSFYVELYKYNGTTFTLIATSSSAPELIAFGTNLNPYFSTLAVPETVLALTDRLSLRYYVNTSGRTITLHTENNHLCQVITTFTTGLTALNGLTSQVQFFAVGTSGTDFAISSASDTHTFNLPTASATNRGALSSADWSTFNNKTSNLGTVTSVALTMPAAFSVANSPITSSGTLAVTATGTTSQYIRGDGTLATFPSVGSGTVTSVGLSSATSGVTIGSTPITTSGTITLAIATASGSQNGLLSSTDWTTFNGKQNALTNPVTGTGTSGQIAYFNGTSAITGESGLVWDATNNYLSIGGATPNSNLTVSGSDNTDIFTVLAGANSRLHVGTVTTGTNVYVRSQNNYTLNLGVNTSNYLSIFNTGRVFIGSSASDSGFTLDVNGTGRFINGVNMATTSGNVGIGTASPSAKLDLGGFSGAVDGTKGIRLTNNAGTIVALEVGSIGDSYIGTNSGSDFSIRSNSTSVITVTSNLNVGIGTGSPLARLDVSSGALTGALIVGGDFNTSTGARTNANRKYAVLGVPHYTNAEEPMTFAVLNSDATVNQIIIGGGQSNLNAATSIEFYTGANNTTVTGTERMRITSDGYARLSTNSNGIQFNGDTAAANALDDYEEGTWTPTINGGYTGITYAFQNGWYIKIGSAVIVSGRVNFSGTANGAGITMACPFTQGPTGYGSGGIPYSDIAVITNTHPYITGGSSSVLFYTTGTGAQIASSANVVDKWLSFVITMSV